MQKLRKYSFSAREKKKRNRIKLNIALALGAIALIVLFIVLTNDKRGRTITIAYDPSKPLPEDVQKQLEEYRSQGAEITFPNEESHPDFASGLSEVDTPMTAFKRK